MGNKKYTWEQIEEALSVAGVDSNSVRQALNEAVDYPNRAEQGVDPEGQETYEPRAPAEKHWADRHTMKVFDPGGSEYEDGTEKIMTADEPSSQSTPAAKTTVSFDRIKQMMSQ
jgi:hypothetical protein